MTLRLSRRIWTILIALLLALVLGFSTLLLPKPGWDVPSAEVSRGEWIESVDVQGELKAVRSVTISAPLGGGSVEIAQIVSNGTRVRKGDLIVQLDTTRALATSRQRQMALRQAEAEVERGLAGRQMQEEQSSTEAQKAQFEVERARLEASKGETLSGIQAARAKLALEEAENGLAEAQARVRTQAASSRREVMRLERRRSKAVGALEEAERELESLTLRATCDGTVTVLPNVGSRRGGRDVPPFRAGDQAWPGAAIAELPDPSALLGVFAIEETDRSRIEIDENVRVTSEAVPGQEFAARVSFISPVARFDASSWPAVRRFELRAVLEEPGSQLRPGMSARARVILERSQDATLIPSSACFERGGRSLVYVRRAWGFEERVVEVSRRSATQVAVARGVTVGERVAMKHPGGEAR